MGSPVTIQLDLSGLTNLVHRLERVHELDYTPLMLRWELVLKRDNAAGALAGLDGAGRPLRAATYRPKAVAHVDYRILPNNNLTGSHYRILAGPPLAPRGLDSRIVTQFRTSHVHEGPGEWAAIGAWEDVLDVKGRPFLRYHFRGDGNLPVRDLRGVRPAAVEAARREARDFVAYHLQQQPQP